MFTVRNSFRIYKSEIPYGIVQSYHLHGSGIQRIFARLCEMLDRSMEEADGHPQA